MLAQGGIVGELANHGETFFMSERLDGQIGKILMPLRAQFFAGRAGVVAWRLHEVL